MNNTSTINLNYNKARNNSKPSYRFLKDLFISKKYNIIILKF